MKLVLSDRPFPLDLQQQKSITWIDLSSLNITNCVGCFGCWTKTPGKCVIRDDAVQVYPEIAKSDEILYISHIKYGGYDTVMKTMLERAIPVQKAFIRLLNGETHHVQRAVAMKKATIVAYGDISTEEKELFKRLVARNANNMSFESYQIIFCTKSTLEDTVRKEVAEWETS